jgi:hypothetical protein|tara:strand:+ start:3053 stop:3346 length:294 start_codon:yes stop_codon:yes gene_type:complete
MIFDAGTTTVATAGTEVQISNVTNKVRWIQVKALAANSGISYFGVSDISATNGYELSAGNTLELNFGDQGGTVPFSTFYVDVASSGDKVSWVVILDG